MEISLNDATILLERLNTELTWMNNALTNNPSEIVSFELQDMIFKRTILRDQIEELLKNVKLIAPSEAEKYIK